MLVQVLQNVPSLSSRGYDYVLVYIYKELNPEIQIDILCLQKVHVYILWELNMAYFYGKCY